MLVTVFLYSARPQCDGTRIKARQSVIYQIKCAAWFDSQRNDMDRPRDNTSRLINQSVLPKQDLKVPWRQAGRGLAFLLLVAAGFVLCFAALALQMPKLKVCLNTCSHHASPRCSSHTYACADCKPICTEAFSTQDIARRVLAARSYEAVCCQLSSRSATSWHPLFNRECCLAFKA